MFPDARRQLNVVKPHWMWKATLMQQNRGAEKSSGAPHKFLGLQVTANLP
jgi:hypothetical protein